MIARYEGPGFGPIIRDSSAMWGAIAIFSALGSLLANPTWESLVRGFSIGAAIGAGLGLVTAGYRWLRGDLGTPPLGKPGFRGSRIAGWQVIARLSDRPGGASVLKVRRGSVVRAMKLVRIGSGSDKSMQERRFSAEVEALRRVDSDFVPSLDTCGQVDRFLYFVTEYFEGENLRKRVERDGPLSEEEIFGVASSLLRALDRAHSKNLVHRDVKPSNILISGGSAVLLDFGVVVVPGTETITLDGSHVGTWLYMSPEQAAAKKATTASDMFSLAASIVYASSGADPFPHRSEHHRNADMSSEEYANALDQVPEWMREVVVDCLSDDPGRRPSAAQARAGLGDVRRSMAWSEVVPPAPLQAAPRRLAGAAAFVLMAVAFASIGYISAAASLDDDTSVGRSLGEAAGSAAVAPGNDAPENGSDLADEEVAETADPLGDGQEESPTGRAEAGPIGAVEEVGNRTGRDFDLISSDGGRLVGADWDSSSLAVIVEETGELLCDFETTQALASIAVNATGTFFAAGGFDRRVSVFRTLGCELHFSITLPLWVRALAMSSDGERLYGLTSGAEGTVLRSWSLSDGEELATVRVSEDRFPDHVAVLRDMIVVGSKHGGRGEALASVVSEDPETWELTVLSDEVIDPDINSDRAGIGDLKVGVVNGDDIAVVSTDTGVRSLSLPGLELIQVWPTPGLDVQLAILGDSVLVGGSEPPSFWNPISDGLPNQLDGESIDALTTIEHSGMTGAVAIARSGVIIRISPAID